jgi:hypothetical protein
VLPAILVATEGSGQPAFGAMDALGVPSWAATTPRDVTFDSRWCIQNCQTAERDASSTRTTAQTEEAYAGGLRTTGWTQVAATGCKPPSATGSFTCWQLDQKELDLWVRPSLCTLPVPPPNETTAEPTPSAPAKGAACLPTAVQIKVYDAIQRPGSGG